MFTCPIGFLGGGGQAVPIISNTLGLDSSESQYATLSDSDDFNMGTAYSFVCWVYPTDLSVENGIYNQRESATNFIEFSILATGKMNFKATYGGTSSINIESSTTLLENNLYMIGFEVDGSTVSFVINNGLDPTTGTFSVSPTNLSADLDLGRIDNGTSTLEFNGGFSLPMGFQIALSGPGILLGAALSTIYNSGIAKQPECLISDITDNYAFAIPLNSGVTSGLELLDVSGNANNATLNGSPTPIFDGNAQEIINCVDVIEPSSVNTSLLNGTSQYFNGGDVLNVGTDNYSYTAFFKTTSASTMMILSKQDTSVIFNYMFISGGFLSLNLFCGTLNRFREDTDLSYNDGEWHSVQVYMDRTAPSASFYIDGVSVSSTIITNIGDVTIDSTNTFNFNIGNRDGGPAADLLFDGELAFTGISLGSDLTANSTEMYGSGEPPCYGDFSEGLKSKFTGGGDFWELANWAGHTSQELTGQANGNTLTNINSTPFTGTGLIVNCSGSGTGDITAGFMAQLIGTQNFTSADNSALKPSAGISLSLWMKTTTTTNNTGLIDKLNPGGSAGYLLSLPTASEAKFTIWVGGVEKTVSGTSNVANGQVHNVVCTYDGSDIKIYINGIEEGTLAVTGTIDHDTEVLEIGGDGNSTVKYTGALAFCRIWNRGLSPAEALEQFNSTSTALCFDNLSAGLQSGLIYSPRLSHTGGLTIGDELIDQSPSALTTVNNGAITFVGSGLNVECT